MLGGSFLSSGPALRPCGDGGVSGAGLRRGVFLASAGRKSSGRCALLVCVVRPGGLGLGLRWTPRCP